MTYWQGQRVATNGIMLHVNRAGAGAPLVLLHGVTDNGMCWVRTANALAADYDVILVDARGHGDSDKPSRGYAPEDHAADVIGLIGAMGLENPVLIGHSMGAQTAAFVSIMAPGLVRAMVLEDPPWFGGPQLPAETDAWRQDMIQWIEGLRVLTQQEIVAQQREAAPDWAEEVLAPWAEAKLALSLDIFGEVNSVRQVWEDVAPKVTCPMLLITADVDRGALVTWEIAAEIAKLPQAQTVHIPGAGHNIRREQYAAYMAALRQFVDEVTQG